MTPTYKNIHLKFKLDGNYFNREDLREVAYSYVKEGKLYEQVIGDFLIDWLNEKTYVDVQTSGSTGIPKTIRLDKQAMVHSALATGDFFGVSVGDSALHCLPSNFIAGKMMLVRAMILGLELDLVAPKSNPLKKIKQSYDFCAMVPLQVEKSFEQLAMIKKLIVGGAPPSKQLIKSLQNVATKVYATYGMTETITHIAAKPLNHSIKENNHYHTLPNISIEKDHRNCLVIDAPRIHPKKIITNDVVEIISENKFNWLGRYDNVINSGGIKLYPEQIEEKLSTLISERFFVAGQADEKLGQKLILVIEAIEVDKEAILQQCKEVPKLSKFEVPKKIYTIEKFSETASGKVQRSQTLLRINI